MNKTSLSELLMTTDSYSVSSAYAMYWIIRESVSSWLELRLVTAFYWIECPSGEVIMKAYILPCTNNITFLFVINGAALSLPHTPRTPRSNSNNWTLFSPFSRNALKSIGRLVCNPMRLSLVPRRALSFFKSIYLIFIEIFVINISFQLFKSLLLCNNAIYLFDFFSILISHLFKQYSTASNLQNY